ncbi:hypothetical protein GCM10010156_24480 [Planobispora rosea]|uniref:Oxygen sensor histidine kinase NreB n=1 Tax=Planobispora rosea TaxID=35762 RepID=A0A8J3S2G3_PLARO|nr:sensor histidine kinase [Planobispora rosea]GGS64488.1 hypothetical protein GCM10010156_24480 [Planobispora rosea]GIH84612.1 hypothetical protein Pro02_30200 [Planobispora rosea]
MYSQAGGRHHTAPGGEAGAHGAGGTGGTRGIDGIDGFDGFDGPRPSAMAAFLTSPPGILAAVTALASLLLAVWGFVAGLGLPPGWNLDIPATPDTAAGVTFPLVGIFLLAHGAPRVTGWLMCAGGLGCAVNIFATSATLAAGAAGDMAAAGYLRWLMCLGWGIGGVLLGVIMPLFSPDGRLPSPRWRPVLALAIAMIVIQTVYQLLLPSPPPERSPWPEPIPNPIGVEALAPYAAAGQAVMQSILVGLVAVAVVSLVVRFRRADATGRRQIAWPVSAFAIYTFFLAGGQDWWLMSTSWTVLTAVAIAFAALRYRLYGIDTVISRAFVAAGLIAAVSAVYFGAGAVAGLVLSGYDRIVGLAAALVAGVFFQPLRVRLRRLVDRLMYGTHGDPAALAARLTREVGEAEPGGALVAVAAVIRDGLSVTGVVVEVDGPEARRVELGLLGPAPRVVPLIWHGEPVGRLLLGSPGPRRFAAAYNDRLIAVVTPYAADVAHAIRMTADLQRSRERILTAREEERRRLRRDLHDGLGHALTDMAMSINMAKISLRSAPASADRLLLGLRDGMDNVNQEIRELVYGLRPPTLDELGLAGAVRALAAESGPSVTVDTEGNLSDLPAAVEVAAYRIVQEALTNVRKHAGARSSAVSLRREESALTVRITDDGRGLPEEARSGIGLISMRERASELGGTCAIGPAAGGGTAVEAVLPITGCP